MKTMDRKIVVLGDSGVGKTAIVQRYVRGTFTDEYKPTTGAMPLKKSIEHDGKVVRLVIWDVAGHLLNLHPAYSSDADGAILVCDLTRQPSLELLNRWREIIENKAGPIPFVIAASKSDLAEMPVCHGLEKTDYTVIPTSARTGKNIDRLFLELIAKLA
ncbi:MAG: Rab family GTPase [Thermoplasmata archaeon]